MDRSRTIRLGTLIVLLTLLLTACGQPGTAGGGTTTTQATDTPEAAVTASGDETTAAPATAAASTGGDLLAEVKNRKKLLIATDANYQPQSFRNPDGSWEGFDVDVGREIAKRLGVEPEFMNISWDVITAGSWNGRWDINIGSMTVTSDRKKVLLFTSPYYYAPAAFAVHNDSPAASISDLQGKKVGVGTATTYQDYLQGTLTLEDEKIVQPAPQQVEVKSYETDLLALDDLALGNGTRLDAVLTALPTIQNAIKGGRPFKVLGEPVYYETLAVALDQKSPMPSESLRDEISRIVDELHKDGTLTALSNKHYGIDLTTKK